MPRQIPLLAGLFAFLTLNIWGCTGLAPGFESPAVSISSFRALPGQGVVPRFEIGLHIINPNRDPLDLKGVAYTVSIEGHKILTGVANDLPRIDPYGEGDIILQAGVDLFSSIMFFTDLAKGGRQDEVTYSLNAKLDVGTLSPVIRVNREGTLSLGAKRHQ